MNKVRKTALINSILTFLYVVAVGIFMYYGSMMKLGKGNEILAPITMILLFVFSAALTGYLVLGKPAQMYVDGNKKEALSLLNYTLLYLFVITLLSIVILFSFTH